MKAFWNEIRYFKPEEFTCKCHGLCDHPDIIDESLVKKLDFIRETIGEPLVITSGTRCKTHNAEVGGKSNSAHAPKNGVSYAVDIACTSSRMRYKLLKAAFVVSIPRIGVSGRFIHLDTDPELDPNVMWTYQ
jgi:zinc D-Ala-D-Ala carboxypeptidase